MYVYDRTRPAPAAAADGDEEPSNYKFWDRPARRDTTARPALKGE
jgi:hypothetical protein